MLLLQEGKHTFCTLCNKYRI